MRTLTSVVVLLLTATAGLAFGQQSGSLTIKDGKDVVEGARVFVQTNDGSQELGTTSSAGALAGIDPSWFTVKPQGDVIIRECTQSTEVYLNTSDDSAEESCKKIADEDGNEEDCNCRRTGAFVWSQNMVLQIGSTFPWPWVAAGAGGAVGVVALAGGDDSPQPTTTFPVTTSPDIPSIPHDELHLPVQRAVPVHGRLDGALHGGRSTRHDDRSDREREQHHGARSWQPFLGHAHGKLHLIDRCLYRYGNG